VLLFIYSWISGFGGIGNIELSVKIFTRSAYWFYATVPSSNIWLCVIQLPSVCCFVPMIWWVGKQSSLLYIPLSEHGWKKLLISGGGHFSKNFPFWLRNFCNGAHSVALRTTLLAQGWGPYCAFAKDQFVIIWHWVTIKMLTILLWPLLILLKLMVLSFSFKNSDLLRFSCYLWGGAPENFVKLTSKNKSDNEGYFNFLLLNIYHISSITHVPSSRKIFRKFYDNPPHRTIWQWVMIFIILLFFIFCAPR
jgi:hypothetical protein